jgi:DNA polymerase I-like protein with 3'-5' exonuclease and polymerase domains
MEQRWVKLPADESSKRKKPVNKGSKPTGSPIESDIPVNFKVVGRREWLDKALAPDAITPEQRIEIQNSGDLQPIKDWLNKQPAQGLDTITTGKDKKDSLDPVSSTAKLVLVQYGTQEIIYLIEPALLLEFKELLQSDEHWKIGQNLKRDYEFILKKLGFPLVNMYDSMLAEQVLTAGLEGVAVSLKDLARRYPPQYIITKSVHEDFVNFSEDDKLTKEMLCYAARDVYLLFPAYSAEGGQ